MRDVPYCSLFQLVTLSEAMKIVVDETVSLDWKGSLDNLLIVRSIGDERDGNQKVLLCRKVSLARSMIDSNL